MRCDPDTGQLLTISSQNIFGIIRSLAPLRMTGADFDLLVVGSDSGKISILKYNDSLNRFEKIIEETFGKSGCRRIIPGQYIAVDPAGRAVMIGAIEKQKFVYVLNRDSATNVIISSPLEAHKAHTIVFDVCGVDVGFGNPLFSCIEVDYEDFDNYEEKKNLDLDNIPKKLAFYELELGLNHVTRKCIYAVASSANKLISVPGDAQNIGPGGVLVCSEDRVSFWNVGHKPVESMLPRRQSQPNSSNLLIIAHAILKQKNLFFVMIQTELGDLFKVSLNYKERNVNQVVIQYFDTIQPCLSICLLRSGHLFGASEFSNHLLFQFQSVGDDEENPVVSVDGNIPMFEPRKLRNLLCVQDLDSLAPITDFKAIDLTREDIPQIYTLCGRGPQSTLRVLRYGLAITELISTEMHGSPYAVWTLRGAVGDVHDRYIVVSYSNATLILAVGETVEEIFDSGFETSITSIGVGVVGTDTFVQVHLNGIRLIGSDKRVNEWKAKKQITRCALNSRQVVIALGGGEIVLFEISSGVELIEVSRFETGSEVSSLSLSKVGEGHQRCRYLAIGTVNNRMRLFVVDDPYEPLKSVGVQDLGEHPETVLLSNIGDVMYMVVGLRNGVMIRSRIEESRDALVDVRKNFLGTRPVKLFAVTVMGKPAVLGISSRSWLSYDYYGKNLTQPLSYDSLEYCSGFKSEPCPEGLVAIAGTTLRILSLEKLGGLFNQTSVKLKYTPRRLEIHPATGALIVLETDHRAFSANQMRDIRGEMDVDHSDHRDEDGEQQSNSDFTDLVRADPGKWAGCIRVVDPLTLETVCIKELEEDEAAFSMTTVEFSDRGGEIFLAVGTVKGLILKPRSFSSCFITLYRLMHNNRSLEMCHRTKVDDIPYALRAFQGRLLAGVGRALRIYEVGKKKLLRKCENRSFPTNITFLDYRGDRIFVGDSSQAIFMVKYRKAEKQLVIFADSFNQRYLTGCSVLDYNTVAGADKFGSVFVSRLPEELSEDVENDPTFSEFNGNDGWLGGALNKVQDLVNFYVGETVTVLQKVSMIPGDSGVILFGTMSGSLGVLIPFTSREDLDFFSNLEMQLRQCCLPLCGRDHLFHRSYYFPVKGTVDGDLCEIYATLPHPKQVEIAQQLGCESGDIHRKIEEIRNRFV